MLFFKNALLTFICLQFPMFLFSQQPSPCPENPTMTPFCHNACIVCDFDGFSGINDRMGSGYAPDGFCTFTVHNARWIGFIAGSENFAIQVVVGDCEGISGLEIGMYAGEDCNDFSLITECKSPIKEGSLFTFENTTPLTIGQYYYVVMDGALKDVCQYTFNVLDGSTYIPPFENSGTLTGIFETCSGIPREYTIEAPIGALDFKWTIDGNLVQKGKKKTFTLPWSQNGTYELCVVSSNVCNVGPPSCQEIQVGDIPVTELEAIICDDENYALNDTIQIQEAGIHPFEFVSTQGCDSSVLLNLTHIVCDLEGTIEAIPVACHGEASGQLHFAMTHGTPPFQYTWQHSETGTIESGILENLNEIVSISELPEGNYNLAIYDLFDNELLLQTTLTEPPPINALLTPSNFNGVNISCFGGQNGTLTASSTGGTIPYQYHWSNGNLTASSTDLTAGIYTVTITDSNDCTLILNQTLTEPSPIHFQTLVTPPDCDNFESGILEVSEIAGGISPYIFDNSNNGFTTESVFENLSEDFYTLTTQDTNGCEADTTVRIVAPVLPDITLGDSQKILLGESITLTLESNVALEEISWSSTGNLSCFDCPNPMIQPISATDYRVQIVSEEGCKAETQITVEVEYQYEIIVPNAFSPNGDGINDRFTIFGGSAIKNIQSFQIFSRWGNKVFAQSDYPPNDLSYAWNGFLQSTPLPNGVYAWWAKVAFIDGETRTYSGNITLIK